VPTAPQAIARVAAFATRLLKALKINIEFNSQDLEFVAKKGLWLIIISRLQKPARYNLKWHYLQN
jgi:hypothetical protein